MIGVLPPALVVLGLGFAGGCLLTAAFRRAPGTPHVWAAAVLELALLVQLLVAVVQLVRGERPEELVTFLAYLAVSVLVLPIAVLWVAGERNRWGSAVLGVAGLVVVILVLRLQQVWAGG